MRQSAAGKDMNMTAKESVALGAFTRRQLMNTQQTEKT
jgi:hypothetical protein